MGRSARIPKATPAINATGENPATPGTDPVPSWISADLIEETIAAWQPHVERDLTAEDAITILSNVGRLADLLRS